MSEISFALTGEFIELYKLLKITGLAESGGMAKQAIAAGYVKVNGVVETRKAFKTRSGSQVEFNGETIRVK